MLVDARNVPEGTELEADLCIIGAGAAGITIARQFQGAHPRVVLLESGGLAYDPRTQALYEGRSVGLPYFPLVASRLRYFGGSTNHWGGLCAPFYAEDFERREWIPHSGWPIRRADLDPYYRQAREIVRLRTDDWTVESWQSDDHAPFELGPRTEPRIAQLVPTVLRSFGRLYRKDIETASNVRAYLNANVTEIETDELGRTATRIRTTTFERNRFTVRARIVVLATGGIENPRLLLASNRVQPRGIGNENDLVGRFFTEHPRFEAAIFLPVAPDLRARFYEQHHVGDSELQGYISLTKDVQELEQLVDVQLLMRPVYSLSNDPAVASPSVRAMRSIVEDGRSSSIGELGRSLLDITRDLATGRQFSVPGAPLPVPYPEVVGTALEPGQLRQYLPDLLGDIAAVGYARLRGGAPLDHVVLRTRIDQTPNPDSRVTLDTVRDDLGMPRARLDWRLSRLDRYSAVRTMEIVGAEMIRAGLGRVRLLTEEDDPDWPRDLTGGWHQMGTTRMSDGPERGVVDRNCRVHGMTNLFVTGSSVFTTGGSSTPTLTVVALALRLADHLKRVLG